MDMIWLFQVKSDEKEANYRFFKVSIRAATVFLDAFYHALLVDGESFTMSAAAGRTALRVDAMRPARYGFQRYLNDSFVAVAYGHSPDLHLARLATHIQGPWMCLTASPNIALDNPAPPALDIQPVIGRDLDLLRLEKRLLQSASIYLHGPIGVGKTTFLNRAASMWKSTSFVDAVVSIHFDRDLIRSGQDFSPAIIHQLLSQVDSREHQSRLWSMPSRSLRSYDNAMIDEITTDILSSIDVIIILDGLQIPLARCSSVLVPGSLSEAAASEMLRRISSMLELAQRPTRTTGCHVILTAQSSSPHWLQVLYSDNALPSRHELGPLGLPDAIELSNRTLQSCGVDMQQWSQDDCDCLDAIIDLLQGIPSALRDVLPLHRTLSIPWRDFYPRLQRGLFDSVADLNNTTLASSEIFQTINHLSAVLLRGHFFFFCLPSIFWHETLSVDNLLIILRELVDQLLERDFQTQDDMDGFTMWGSFLSAVSRDLGYTHVHHNKTGMWIHPLLTIIGRPFFSESLSSANSEKLKTLFCKSMETWTLLAQEGTDGRVVWGANHLTSLDFCIEEVPVEYWPLTFFSVQNNRDFSHLPRMTRSLLQEKMLRLFTSIIERFPLLERKQRYPCALFLSTQLLTVSLSGDAHNSRAWEQAWELSSKGLSTLPLVDPHHNTNDVALCTGYLQLTRFFSLARLGHMSQTQESYRTLRLMKEDVFNGLGQDFLPPLELAVQNLASRVENGDNDYLSIRNEMEHLHQNPDFSRLKGLGLFRLLLGFYIVFIGCTATNFLAADSPAPKMRPERSNYVEEELRRLPYIEIEEYKRMMGFNPHNCLTATPAKLDAIGKKVLNDLEGAYNMGDWVQAWEKHEQMVISAMRSCNFDEAKEHLECIQTIFTKAEAKIPSECFDILNKLKKEIHEKHLSYLTIQSLYRSKLGDGDDADRSPLTAGALDSPGPVDVSSERFKERPPATPDEFTAKLSDIQTEPKKWWEWWLGTRGQDLTWVRLVYADTAKHKAEVELMAKLYDAYCTSKDIGSALSVLDTLEAVCNNGLFAHHQLSLSPLQDLRSCLELAHEQFRLLIEWQKALARDDFEGAEALLDELSCCVQPKFFSLNTDADVEAARKAAQRERLIKFSLDLHRAATTDQRHRYRDIYRELVELVGKGNLSRIDPDELVVFRCEALGWLMVRAAKAKSWQEGLCYCEEFLALTQPRLKDRPRVQDDCLNIKEECEWHILQDSLTTAENSRDFEMCLSLLGDIETACARMQETRARPRNTFALLGPKITAFWKGSYRDRCLPCARWAQRKAQEECSCREGRGPNHNRRDFVAPFGCEHHCKGGYCLLG